MKNLVLENTKIRLFISQIYLTILVTKKIKIKDLLQNENLISNKKKIFFLSLALTFGHFFKLN